MVETKDNEEFGEEAAATGHAGEGEGTFRVRTPRGNEIIGIVDQLLGFRKMYIRCADGKTRLCRVPGRFRRSMWVRQADVVIIEPWEYDNTKGDIVYDYRKTQIEWLRERGFLKKLEEF
ncbi:Translation initiation factor 1A [Candidatus Tiddalikarchaeum anstoanum]|nr:Translation initiation factor 1A [Candidatus Tiddalikarchaeum anstoanum]